MFNLNIMFDLIAEVSEYSPVGKSPKPLKIKSPIPQALNIIPGQYLYPYAGPPNENGNRSLYLFLHEINFNQYFLTIEFENINSFIKLSNDLANYKVNIIASKYLAFSNNNTVSLIYDIQEPRKEWFGDDFLNFIKDNYKDIKVVKSFWYWNECDQDAKLYVSLLRNKMDFQKKKVFQHNTISFNKSDFIKLGFDEPTQIKACVQLAYPEICAIVLHFFDHNRIKKMHFGYPNIPGSYAGTLQLLSDLKIENLFNIQKNTQMDQREGYTTDVFIVKYPHELENVLILDDKGDYKKLKQDLNEMLFLNNNGNYTELLKNLSDNDKNKKEFIKYLSNVPKRIEKIAKRE